MTSFLDARSAVIGRVDEVDLGNNSDLKMLLFMLFYVHNHVCICVEENLKVGNWQQYMFKNSVIQLQHYRFQ